MIERFMVIRNCKTLGYEISLNDAKALIKRNFRKNKEDLHEVKDLEKDVYVCVKDFVASLKVVKHVRKPVKKPKQGRNDVIDDQYSVWLGKQPCIVTGIIAKRGINAHDMHCHHIHGRRGQKARNDYMQVPLLGSVHSWGDRSYHSCTKREFIERWRHIIGAIDDSELIEYFEDHAKALKEQYDLEMDKGDS